MSETNESTVDNGGDNGDAEVVRRDEFDIDGVLELDITLGSGRVAVNLVDKPGARVELRHDPHDANPFAQSLSSLMTWIGGQFGGAEQQEASPADAVRQSRIDLTGTRLVVRTPTSLALRGVPISVTIEAPAGSHINVRAGSANVTTSGEAGRLDLSTATGDVTTASATGVATVRTGSGTIRLGEMTRGLRARSGSGDVDVAAVGGTTSVGTGTGGIWFGAVDGDVMVRTGSGDVTIASARAGQIDMTTGSGRIRVGVKAGTRAEVDLSSGAGTARSELDLSDTPPTEEPGLRVRGRTGSGSAVITRAS
ncbi:putative adhesin [Herbihabitans rhizosphaerae]|uniref:Putative adhesin n=1 Tax=Herbihabitans rhizosphaerae TaxID=1872711 RepID=A0A4Q7KII6_9PSEU|nr:DUF4097 family beta strand repeat-containing protein [Herbihabitans rhizosphaerae]RZS34741.1 putative adhesin [Herbihabitans rhizosphaerae]